MRRFITLAAFATVLGLAGEAAAHGDVKCEATRADRRPSVDLQKMLKAQGWTVRKIVVTNGCYEVYARDAKNDKKEVFFHPKTLQRVTAPE